PTPPEAFSLPAHAPLRLDDPEARWIVEAGSVALFALRAALPPATEGTRHYLGSIAEGGLVCGLGTDLAGTSAIAVGAGGTRLRPLPPGALAALDPAPLGAAIDAWAEALAGGLARPLLPRPQADLALAPRGARQRPPAGTVVVAAEGARGGPLWLRLGGDWLLLGLERVGGLVPLPPGAWLTGGAGASCRPASAAEALRSGDWQEGLAGFNAALLE
ncbi:hypothetical protein, partial [Teichococcus deserti]|uniref:hypothetical protein n=1 Tax=Teichococcus deserti TaxID=1817963 RepID=UPI0038CF90DE